MSWNCGSPSFSCDKVPQIVIKTNWGWMWLAVQGVCIWSSSLSMPTSSSRMLGNMMYRCIYLYLYFLHIHITTFTIFIMNIFCRATHRHRQFFAGRAAMRTANICKKQSIGKLDPGFPLQRQWVVPTGAKVPFVCLWDQANAKSSHTDIGIQGLVMLWRHYFVVQWSRCFVDFRGTSWTLSRHSLCFKICQPQPSDMVLIADLEWAFSFRKGCTTLWSLSFRVHGSWWRSTWRT